MTLQEQFLTIQKKIHDTTLNCQRATNSVTLLAVSKGQTALAIREAYTLGITNIGENYWQEASKKMAELNDLPIIWHMIGPLQSNKCKDIAQKFSWVHSVDREKTAGLLSLNRPEELGPLSICIQVNLDDEDAKSGVHPEELNALVRYISTLPNLSLRGLMTIPKPRKKEEEQYQSFKRLATLLDSLNESLGLKMDTLSMGMSDDFIPAICAGSTIVRIGSALFGLRK